MNSQILGKLICYERKDFCYLLYMLHTIVNLLFIIHISHINKSMIYFYFPKLSFVLHLQQIIFVTM